MCEGGVILIERLRDGTAKKHKKCLTTRAPAGKIKVPPHEGKSSAPCKLNNVRSLCSIGIPVEAGIRKCKAKAPEKGLLN